MDAEIRLRAASTPREPSVLVAAWLLAELSERAVAVDTGPDLVRLVLPGDAVWALRARVLALLTERRFDGWILDDLHADPLCQT